MSHAHEIHLSSQGPSYPAVKLSVLQQPLIRPTPASKHVLIIGGGVSGLMTAWVLLDKGYRVTILAKDWAWTRDWQKLRLTSQIAGALWEFPPGGCGLTEIASSKPGFANIEHYQEWALQSLEFYTRLNSMLNGRLKTEFGVCITKLNQFFYRKLDDSNHMEYSKLGAIQKAADIKRMSGLKIHNTSELESIFDNVNVDQEWRTKLQAGYTHDAPVINTDKAIVFLMTLVRNKGAQFETREFDGKHTLAELSQQLAFEYKNDAIVNATGLGARELAGDSDVYPARGAIKRIRNDNTDTFKSLNEAYLIPAQKGDNGEPTKVVFLVPRNDETLIVGSIVQPNNEQLNLSESSPEVEVMWKRARGFLPSLNDAATVPWHPLAQGLRPFTKNNVKVRAEDAHVPIIHNYGHGGSGWTLATGCARSATNLLEQMLDAKLPAKKANRTLYPAFNL